MKWRGIIDRFGERLAIAKSVPAVTLCEGNTPLIPAPRLAAAISPDFELHLKYEGLNPTGSFKDRGMTTAMTQALADGSTTVICASTGNTAASAAAYAARAGLKCIVLIPQGKVALGKLAGAVAYGAKVVQIQGSFDDGLKLVRQLSERTPIALVNSVNPARLEGQKTAAWEITDQLDRVPDWLCLPVGNAGNISAYWMGFCENSDIRPRLLGAQAEGAAPIVLGKVVENPETEATAIRIGNPARWNQAVDALKESDGRILSVSDKEIFDAYHMVAQLEGVFCEPSSAAGIAGLRKAVQQGLVDVRGKVVATVLTGHGLKDPDSATKDFVAIKPIEPSIDSLLEQVNA